ncbi:MAG: hypothetical protein AB7T31_14990 [Gemmatimonadales bacterium]
MSRPTTETLGPRFVADELVKAEEHLVNAQRATQDQSVARSIDFARRELAPAVKRARMILKDVALRTARQLDLSDPTQEVTDGNT